MNTHDEFESRLRGDLARLAGGAPAGPNAERVLAALRQREARRRWWRGAAAIAAGLAIAVTAGALRVEEGTRAGGFASLEPRAKVSADAPSTPGLAAAPRLPSTDDDSNWSIIPASLSISAPAARTPSLHEGRFDLDLSLSLRLALSEPAEEATPVLRLSSPSWR